MESLEETLVQRQTAILLFDKSEKTVIILAKIKEFLGMKTDSKAMKV